MIESIRVPPELQDGLNKFLLLRRPTGKNLISKVPRSIYYVLCTRDGLRNLLATFRGHLLRPGTAKDRVYDLYVDVQKCFPHLFPFFCELSIFLSVANVAVVLSYGFALAMSDDDNWVGLVKFIGGIPYFLLLESLMMNCYMRIAEMLKQERNALTKEDLSNEEIRWEQEHGVEYTVDDDASYDDDDGSSSCTSVTASMTSCCSSMDDPLVWETKQCGNDLSESREGNKSCTENIVLIENLDTLQA